MSLYDKTPEIEALLNTGPVEYARIVDVFLDDQTLNLWDQFRPVTIDEGTPDGPGPVVYQPAGDTLIPPDEITEDQSLEGSTIDIAFDSSRISDNSTFLGGLLDTEYLQRRVRIRSVLFEPGTGRTVPLWLFNTQNGVIDEVRDVVQSGQPSILTISIASGTFAYLERRNFTFSNEDQQLLWPGDTGLEHLAQLVNVELPWNGEFDNG